MMARTGSGWQYILADLALILFMVTAAALAQSDDAPAAPARPRAATGPAGRALLSPQAEPLAVYRVAHGAPPIAAWLREQSTDARQQLTIVAQYRAGGQAAALGEAEALARDAGAAGTRARIVIEPGPGGTTAALAFDAPDAMARNLQEAGRNR